VPSVAHGDNTISHSNFVGPDGQIRYPLSCVLECDLLVNLSGEALMDGAAARRSDALQHRQSALQFGPSSRQLRKIRDYLQETAFSERSNGGAIELDVM
jgi:hypothetical protein